MARFWLWFLLAVAAPVIIAEFDITSTSENLRRKLGAVFDAARVDSAAKQKSGEKTTNPSASLKNVLTTLGTR